MLTPDYLDSVADDIVLYYQKLEDSIIEDIARRIVKNGHITDSAKWQIERLESAGMLYNNILNRLSKSTGLAKSTLQTIFEDAAVESIAFDNEIYRRAGLNPIPISQSPEALNTLLAGLNKTNGALQNLTLTTAVTSQTAYLNGCDIAYAQIAAGAMDYATAIRNAVKGCAEQGLSVLYPSGHQDKIDVAVRRATLTGVGQTCGQIQLAYAESLGSDFMEITAHAGARPSHAAWQGKVVSLSGQKGYLSLSSIGYGSGNGFKGWNCRHDWFPFFPGISHPAYSKKDLHDFDTIDRLYNGEKMTTYEATQIQRGFERDIRQTKRELVGINAAMDESTNPLLKAGLKNDFTEKSVTLKKQKALLDDFLDQTGLDIDRVRTQSLNFNRSVAQKAVWANKNTLLPNYKKAIIPDKKIVDYALNMDHPTGRNKAIAFEKYLGYNKNNKDMLIEEVRKGLNQTSAKERKITAHGAPYEVKMRIKGANGKYANIKTGWIIDNDSDIPRLTSIYVDE